MWSLLGHAAVAGAQRMQTTADLRRFIYFRIVCSGGNHCVNVSSYERNIEPGPQHSIYVQTLGSVTQGKSVLAEDTAVLPDPVLRAYPTSTCVTVVSLAQCSPREQMCKFELELNMLRAFNGGRYLVHFIGVTGPAQTSFVALAPCKLPLYAAGRFSCCQSCS